MGGLNLWAYVAGSTVLAVAMVTNAFQMKEQFYPAMVYMARSKPCMMVFGNLGVMLTILLGQLVKKMFLGKLRDIEVEHLTDRIKATITDTLLAMTIFRNEFNGTFVMFFTFVMFLKIFHWLSLDRVDYIQHAPASNFALFRIFSLMSMMSILDGALIYYTASVTYAKGPSMMILWGFDALLLLFSIISGMVKFVVNVVDSRQQVQWERKGSFLLHLEFVTDICQFGVYLVFFAVIMIYYGLPLHIIRNVYITFNAIKQSVATLYRYKMATANMNERFPEVGADELNEDNNLCIVCREEMQTARKLPCGHILHAACLLNWLQRQQTCPICRMSVLAPPTYATAPRPQQQQQHQHQPHPHAHPHPHPHQPHTHAPQQQQQPHTHAQYYVPREQPYTEAGPQLVGQQTTPVQQQPPQYITEEYGSASSSYTHASSVSTLSAEAEILQTLQVLQLQVTALQEQVSFLTDQLQQAGFGQTDNNTTRGEQEGKGKEKEEKEVTVNNDNIDDPAEQLRQRRLMRFSNQ